MYSAAGRNYFAGNVGIGSGTSSPTAALDVNGPLHTYANAAPWLPTPTPTPKPANAFRPPAGANPGQQAVIDEIVAVFGSYSQGALAVSKCESGYDPNAWNSYPILNSHASGVFQILYPSTWNTTLHPTRYSRFRRGSMRNRRTTSWVT